MEAQQAAEETGTSDGQTGPCSAGQTGPCSDGQTGPCSAGQTGPCSAGQTGPCSAGETGPCSAGETPVRSGETGQTDALVNLESNTEMGESVHDPDIRLHVGVVKQGLFQNDDDVDEDDDDEEEDDDDDDDDSGTEYFTADHPAGTRLQRAQRGGSQTPLPDTFHTGQLLYYERFKAYQDYMLGDCRSSEVRSFTADYLQKALGPCGWRALWCTDVFDVLVEVEEVEAKELKARVRLVLPLLCEGRGCRLTEEAMAGVLEATLSRVPLTELHVLYHESGDFDQTALALEHLRFFYRHIWRKWDEEDEDDDFDYFVRCVEPRLRLHYDILEERVPVGLVQEYRSLLRRCEAGFQEFSSLRNGLSSDSEETELDNVSMVEGLRLYEHMEGLKRKLRILENPLLRYVLGYKGNSAQPSCLARGQRECGGRAVHVVSGSTSIALLTSLLVDKLQPQYEGEHYQVQFHSDPVAALSCCYEGDVVMVLPGHYQVTSNICMADSIVLEGFGLPDEVVIEKKSKGDSFLESTGAEVKISNIKFIQHDAIEGILCVRQGKLEMENCVLQCETTGVIVRTSAQLTMNMCDLYGSKGAGVEIYPGSVCRLLGNGIHHCKEGILIKDFADELDSMPQITMVNNVIHNNQGYGVILVKPGEAVEGEKEEAEKEEGAGGGGGEDGEGDGGGEILSSAELDVPLAAAVDLPPPAPASPSPYGVPPAEVTEGNGAISRELAATSARKLRRQRSRVREQGEARADHTLLSQGMFTSIHGNQFRRNGMGSFGTFLY